MTPAKENTWRHKLTTGHEAVVSSQAQTEAAYAARDADIRAALADGVGVAAICRWTGLSRERVYQVRARQT